MWGVWCGGMGVNSLCSYLCSNSVERESQEADKGERGEWKQSQVQDNDKVKCALNGSVQSERDKAQPADKVRATEGNGRSGTALGRGPVHEKLHLSSWLSGTTCWRKEHTQLINAQSD